jgi:hypothetical protein
MSKNDNNKSTREDQTSASESKNLADSCSNTKVCDTVAKRKYSFKSAGGGSNNHSPPCFASSNKVCATVTKRKRSIKTTGNFSDSTARTLAESDDDPIIIHNQETYPTGTSNLPIDLTEDDEPDNNSTRHSGCDDVGPIPISGSSLHHSSNLEREFPWKADGEIESRSASDEMTANRFPANDSCWMAPASLGPSLQPEEMHTSYYSQQVINNRDQTMPVLQPPLTQNPPLFGPYSAAAFGMTGSVSWDQCGYNSFTNHNEYVASKAYYPPFAMHFTPLLSHGFQENSFQANGFQENIFQANGFQENGFQANGFQANGFQANGFQANGFQANGFQANGINHTQNRSLREIEQNAGTTIGNAQLSAYSDLQKTQEKSGFNNVVLLQHHRQSTENSSEPRSTNTAKRTPVRNPAEQTRLAKRQKSSSLQIPQQSKKKDTAMETKCNKVVQNSQPVTFAHSAGTPPCADNIPEPGEDSQPKCMICIDHLSRKYLSSSGLPVWEFVVHGGEDRKLSAIP